MALGNITFTNICLYPFSLIYYFLWAPDSLILSDTVTPFNMEAKANVNLWSLMVTVKTLSLEFAETITALDLC